MNGVTGRMGYNQHLVRSILAIRDAGGIALADGTMLWPEPILVGRDERKLRTIAERHGLDTLDHVAGRGAGNATERRYLFRRAGHVGSRTRNSRRNRGGEGDLHRKPIAESTE